MKYITVHSFEYYARKVFKQTKEGIHRSCFQLASYQSAFDSLATTSIDFLLFKSVCYL